MLLFAKLDPTVAFVSVLAILIILLGLILKRFKQPYIIGYIIVGALIGEHGIGLIKDADSIHHLGEIGIILLLFFIGMEISLPELVKQWKLAVVGTLLQVGVSVLIVLSIGHFFNWNINRSIILGFVIALSSSAVIIKIIQDKHLITTRIGKNVLSILLMQDIIIVPLLIITSIIGGKEEPIENIILMIIGASTLIGLVVGLLSLGVADMFHVPGIDFADVVNSTNLPIWSVSVLALFAVGIPFFYLFILGLKILVNNIKSLGKVANISLTNSNGVITSPYFFFSTSPILTNSLNIKIFSLMLSVIFFLSNIFYSINIKMRNLLHLLERKSRISLLSNRVKEN